MKSKTPTNALNAAVKAARAVGRLMRANLDAEKKVNEHSQHDIKLELDVRSQLLIEKMLRRDFPEIPVLGEEGISGDLEAPRRWVIDPIDGTVNFTYGLPHACVSIALQQRREKAVKPGRGAAKSDYMTTVGVVYDPFCDEMWTATQGGPALMNGKRVHVSTRKRLNEAIVAMGFAKYETTLNRMLPVFNQLVPRVRKIRIMGAAALSMVWVAAGRMDAYKELGVRLWDIAAGGLIVEAAGGEFWHRPVDGDYTYEIVVSNGLLRRQIEAATRGI
jgi:myo-inositol-1(or 4)-monophosphatase